MIVTNPAGSRMIRLAGLTFLARRAVPGSARVPEEILTIMLPINGVKLSGRLWPIHVQADPDHIQIRMPLLCRLLSEARINVAYMTSSGAQGASGAFCCIEMEERERAEGLIGQQADLKAQVRFGPAMGLLTLFPHNADLKLLGLALQALSERGIMVFGLASSISALTFVLDFNRLGDAASALGGYLQMPDGTLQLQPEFKVQQVGAVEIERDRRPV